MLGPGPLGSKAGSGARPGRIRRKWDGPAGHTCRSSGKQNGPGGRHGSRSTPRKPFIFGFRARTSGRVFRDWRPGGRHGSRSTTRKPFIFGFRARTSGREFRVWGPAGRHGSRSPSRKPFVFGFRARTSGREFRDSRPAGRVFQGAVCSLLPANPCGSVPGSKFFTQIPRLRTKKHLAGLSARCFPLLNSPPQVPVPRGTFN